jgi:hypothetical protein
MGDIPAAGSNKKRKRGDDFAALAKITDNSHETHEKTRKLKLTWPQKGAKSTKTKF